jgi:acyl-coenzyme A thioesterase PaaI-like protein
MQLIDKIKQARENNNIDSLFELIPYTKMLNMSSINMGKELVFVLAENKDNIGNPVLPALHGGAIGGFMENCAVFHILGHIDTSRIPKTIDFSIDYLSVGRLKNTYATCEVVRQGKKVINVDIIAWQEHRNNPIARARAHLLL